ncbi:MAG: DUF559 domain-containing protein [Ruminococcaceae bacterium]|nr:DUF559 domain-containing protein [Oscillospiraceae bacterium]
MIYKYNKKYVSLAQNLRKNMTREEKRLWYDFLKKLPITVNRQKNIGNYIVDFFIAKNRIVIEIDGQGHGFEENIQKDKNRDEDFDNLGITVLRYTNEDINRRFNSVCQDILLHLGINENNIKF